MITSVKDTRRLGSWSEYIEEISDYAIESQNGTLTRPTIKVTDEGAAAQMIEPIVNMPTADANTFLNSKSE